MEKTIGNKVLSVIIPTYNMEDYLRKCLSSLVLPDASLMHSLEVIVVIDGATDSSSKIAHEYQDAYPDTFRVIDKENGNYGSCVNRGLKEATAKYIRVLDADDSYNTENLSRFLQQLSTIDCDLLLTDYNIVDASGNVSERRTFDVKSDEVIDVTKVQRPVAELEMHAITYRREILLDLNYWQTEGISYTDTEWAFIPLMAVSTVCYLNIQVYNYLVGRAGQTMDAAVFRKGIHHILKVNDRLMNIYADEKLYNHKNKFLFDHRIDGLVTRTYGQVLYDNILNRYELRELDQKVKRLKPALYEKLADLNDGHVWYVREWRKHDYVLPWYLKALVMVVYFKRRYL